MKKARTGRSKVATIRILRQVVSPPVYKAECGGDYFVHPRTAYELMELIHRVAKAWKPAEIRFEGFK